MNEFDPAQTAASANFATFLAAVLDRADSQQRPKFQASLAAIAGRLDPEARRTDLGLTIAHGTPAAHRRLKGSFP